MRCLKIPNTAHFKEITKIEDLALHGISRVMTCHCSALMALRKIVCGCCCSALEEAITLYEKLKRDAEEQTFRPEQAVREFFSQRDGQGRRRHDGNSGDEVRCRMSNAKTSRAT